MILSMEQIISFLFLGGAGLSLVMIIVWLALYLRQIQLGNRQSKLEMRKLELEIWHLERERTEKALSK